MSEWFDNVTFPKSPLEKKKKCALLAALVNKSPLGFISSLGSMPLSFTCSTMAQGN